MTAPVCPVTDTPATARDGSDPWPEPWWAPLQPALGAAWHSWRCAPSADGPGQVATALNRQFSERQAAARLAGTVPAAADVQVARAVLVAAAVPVDGRPLRFVPHAALPPGEPYEAFVDRTGSVPTRDNLHDFFNGVVWLALPALKQRFNQLQAAEIRRAGGVRAGSRQAGIATQRGPLRDALTLFDENGALLDGPAPLLKALRQRDWAALFSDHRALWAQARLTIVGHALLEKLATAPRKALTAHVLVGTGLDNAMGRALAMDGGAWAHKPFLPLPVLGVPGWWAGNEAPGFYDDSAVFRAPRINDLTDGLLVPARPASGAQRRN